LAILLATTIPRAGDLGNLEEFLRPFLGRMRSTDRVHGSTRARRNPLGDYEIQKTVFGELLENATTMRLLNPIEQLDVEPQAKLAVVTAGVDEIKSNLSKGWVYK
jgi:hypothetical protein